MANAAKLLLELIDSWKGPEEQSVETRRGVGSADSLDFWLCHTRATEYLREIERDLHAIQEAVPDAEADAYLPALVPLYKAVFGFDPRWGSARGTQQQVPAIPDDVRIDLRRISGFLATNSLRLALTDDRRASLSAELVEFVEAVAEAGHLTEARRGYILALLKRAREALDDDRYSDGQLRDLLAQVEAIALAAAMNPSATSSFQQKAKRVTTSIALIIGGILGTQLVEATLTPEITTVSEQIREIVGLPAAEDNTDGSQDVPVGS